MINILNGFITIISNICRIESYIYSEIIVRIQRTLDTLVLKKKTYVINIYKPKMTENVFLFFPCALTPSIHLYFQHHYYRHAPLPPLLLAPPMPPLPHHYH